MNGDMVLPAFFTILLLFLGLIQSPHTLADNSKKILGYIETVNISEIDLELKAKLDTGATTSSIHAEILKVGLNALTDTTPHSGTAENAVDDTVFDDVEIVSEETKSQKTNQNAKDMDHFQNMRIGDPIVFRIVTDDENIIKTLRKDIIRIVRIKKKDGGIQRRPVVNMTFCIAGKLVEGDVNLADRENFNYEVLVGRNMLEKGEFIVDSSQTFTDKTSCNSPVALAPFRTTSIYP